MLKLEQLAQEFIEQRQNICKRLSSYQDGDENDLGFCLNIINHIKTYDQESTERKEYENMLQETRNKARDLLVESRKSFNSKDESPEQQWFVNRGYRILVNAFIIGGPIDTYYWLLQNNICFDYFNDWNQVIFLIFKSNDLVYLDLLYEFVNFQRKSTWLDIKDDPWPSKIMDKLMTNMIMILNDREKYNDSDKQVLDTIDDIWNEMVCSVGSGRYDQLEDDD